MNKWLNAARLRTLPLALSSIIMGAFWAKKNEVFEIKILLLAMLTTVFLQVLSNFANDYGDTQNGADSQERIGPLRAVQSGDISPKAMFQAIIITAILAFLSGVILLYLAFGGFSSNLFWILLAIGILSIFAAYFYTAGKKPYGYLGLGDISVFIFFGIVGVSGSYMLFSKSWNSELVIPSIVCGALATGVLNLNNIRDITSDKSAGKITIPVRLGKKNARIYHYILLSIAFFTLVGYNIFKGIDNYYYLLSLPLIVLNGYQLYKIDNPDPLLKKLALSSLATSILWGFSII